MRAGSIELYIKELVLNGLGSFDRQQISSAVSRELSRLFLERGLPKSFEQRGNIVSLNGDSLEINDSSTANEVGVKVAQALYTGMI